MKNFPFIEPKYAMVLLRVSVAIVFLSHAIVRIVNSTIPQFGGFLESKGFPYGWAWVWAITMFEIVGGLLLVAGFFTRWLAAGFIFILIVGIVLIHASLGWFVGEHGTGGSEYSFILIMALVAIAAFSTNPASPDKEV